MSEQNGNQDKSNNNSQNFTIQNLIDKTTKKSSSVFKSSFSIENLLKNDKNEVVKAFGKRLTSLLADRSNNTGENLGNV